MSIKLNKSHFLKRFKGEIFKVLSICSHGPAPGLPNLTYILFFCRSFQVGWQNSIPMEENYGCSRQTINENWTRSLLCGPLSARQFRSASGRRTEQRQEGQWAGKTRGAAGGGHLRFHFISFQRIAWLCSTGFGFNTRWISMRSSTQAAGWRWRGEVSPTEGPTAIAQGSDNSRAVPSAALRPAGFLKRTAPPLPLLQQIQPISETNSSKAMLVFSNIKYTCHWL